MNRQSRSRFRATWPAVMGALVMLLSLRPATAQQPEERLQRSFPLTAGGTLRVENYKGAIHILGSDSKQVVVSAWKRFEGSDADRKWWMDNTEIHFNNDSGRVEVAVRYPNQSWSCWLCWNEHNNYLAQVDLEIQVPRHSNLDLDGYKPDIRISSVDGDIRIKSYKAPMTIESTTGSLRIDTYKDVIRIKNVAARGGLEVHSYKAEADIDVKSLEGAANIETGKGSIVLRVPEELGMEVDFAGNRRSVFNTEFPVSIKAGDHSRQAVRGAINGGGAQIHLRTDRGSVFVKRRSGEL